MPHFKVMGLDKKHVNVFSNKVIKNIAQIASCQEKLIKIWFIDSLVVEDQIQENDQAKIFIEIAWKKRSELVMQEMAQYIDLLFKDHLKALTYITFTNIENSYYVGGVK